MSPDGLLYDELPYFEECVRTYELEKVMTGGENREQAKDQIALIHDAIVLGIKDYFGKLGFKTAIATTTIGARKGRLFARTTCPASISRRPPAPAVRHFVASNRRLTIEPASSSIANASMLWSSAISTWSSWPATGSHTTSNVYARPRKSSRPAG